MINEKKCIGCMACVDSCPRRCIEKTIGSDGAVRIKIDHAKCVKCDLCNSVCMLENPLDFFKKPYDCFAFWSKRKKIYRESSSGGFCFLLYKQMIESGWKVYGVRYDQDFRPIYSSCEKVDDLYKFQGSKYVYADAQGIYKKIKEELKQGEHVLFVGLPCTVHALYQYIGNENLEKLYTIDLICSGVSSYRDFADYVEWIKKEYRIKRISDVTFRGKRDLKFSLVVNDIALYSKRLDDDYFWWCYQNQVIIEKKCKSCKYRKQERVGDLTVGDFWNLKKSATSHPFGANLILVNSKKGGELLSCRIKDSHIEKHSVNEAFECANFGENRDKNLYHSFYHFFYNRRINVMLMRAIYNINSFLITAKLKH